MRISRDGEVIPEPKSSAQTAVHMYRVSRRLSITTLVAIAALALSAVALAAKPVKGATYKGRYGTSNVVRFKVSANGKTVTKMHFATFPPNKCGSGGPVPKPSSKPAKITNGKFKVRLTYSYTGGPRRLTRSPARSSHTARRRESSSTAPSRVWRRSATARSPTRRRPSRRTGAQLEPTPTRTGPGRARSAPRGRVPRSPASVRG